MSLITLPDHTIGLLGGHGVTVATPFVQTIALLQCEIAGTGHHSDDTTAARLAQTPILALIREPANPHDPDAIAVVMGGQKIGYIPRQHNPVLARLLDAGKCLRARVDGPIDAHASRWYRARVVVEMEG
jgi:hypothetical protein